MMHGGAFVIGMTMIEVDYAKSGRSTCKSCKDMIQKGELRLATSLDCDQFSGTKWYHWKCFELPRKFKQAQYGFNPEKHVLHLDNMKKKDQGIIV